MGASKSTESSKPLHLNLELSETDTHYNPLITSTKGGVLIPVLLTLLVGQGALLFGFHIGFSSPTEHAVILTTGISQQSSDLMFSLLSIGAIFGCLLTTTLATRLGRKPTILLSTLPFAAGALTMTLWDSMVGLCIGRLMCGFGVGLASVFVPLYIAETSPVHLRGSLGVANQFLIAGGIVIVNCLGLPIINDAGWWKPMMLLSCIPVGVMLLGVLFLGVETPRWLLTNGKDREAERALAFMRGPDYDIAAEINEIQQIVHQVDNRNEDEVSLRAQFQYLVSQGLRPFLIGITLQLLQQWSGINAIMFHTTALFIKNTDSPSDSERQTALYGAIACNGIQVFMCGVILVCMSKAGRRFFLILSSLGVALCSILVGFGYYLEWSQNTLIALVMCYLGFFSLGVGPLPWLVCSEIFPARCRELAMSIATIVNWSCAFAVTSTMNDFEQLISASGVFWFYGAVCIFGAGFVYFVLPETKDKTLEEIEHEFQDGYQSLVHL